MNYRQLYQVFSDQEEKEHMKTYSTEDSISVAEQNQKNMEADLERDSSMTHFHQARKYPHYPILKVLDTEGEWLNLWEINDKRGGELPKELQGSFTDVPTAIRTLETYLKNRKLEKESN
jgi:hypothetical protein